jgi:hypothetical protein
MTVDGRGWVHRTQLHWLDGSHQSNKPSRAHARLMLTHVGEQPLNLTLLGVPETRLPHSASLEYEGCTQVHFCKTPKAARKQGSELKTGPDIYIVFQNFLPVCAYKNAVCARWKAHVHAWTHLQREPPALASISRWKKHNSEHTMCWIVVGPLAQYEGRSSLRLTTNYISIERGICANTRLNSQLEVVSGESHTISVRLSVTDLLMVINIQYHSRCGAFTQDCLS